MYTALHLNTNYNPHHNNSSDGNIILYKTAKFTIVIMFTATHRYVVYIDAATLLVKFLVVLDTWLIPQQIQLFLTLLFSK